MFILVSVEARFGATELIQLKEDMYTRDGEFHVHEWTFQTNDKQNKTLAEIPYYAG
jgi:hypothetical protein